MKTNKSYSKRLKATKGGKLIARKPGHCHFNAKESGSKQLDKKRTQAITLDNKKQGRFLPHA